MPHLRRPRALAVASLLLLAACTPRSSTGKSEARSPPATAMPVKPPPRTTDEATRALIEASTFEDVEGSYDGHLTDGVRSFRVVFAAPDAPERFREIFVRGTLVGQLYAVIGLRHHDPAAYAEGLARVRVRANEWVPALSACDADSQRVGDILESRDPAAIRLARGQTLEEWRRLHPSSVFDVVGGGFTSHFGQVPARF